MKAALVRLKADTIQLSSATSSTSSQRYLLAYLGLATLLKSVAIADMALATLCMC